ncbi:hypothetical protein EB796_007353 [Bugula neritina]|uniref:Uncharacterized protein n=1 Tax=Bugula neritina TaxID=10212 RepID=A0A7J7K9Q1_BUGNE|nr:hypothetical protein EB796_007353 [Bugula neritina]
MCHCSFLYTDYPTPLKQKHIWHAEELFLIVLDPMMKIYLKVTKGFCLYLEYNYVFFCTGTYNVIIDTNWS